MKGVIVLFLVGNNQTLLLIFLFARIEDERVFLDAFTRGKLLCSLRSTMLDAFVV